MRIAKGNSDKYQFILPYYDLNTIISPKFINGSVTLNSNGSNDLNNTNQLYQKLQIIYHSLVTIFLQNMVLKTIIILI